jgi:signal transduction histidine kinase
LFGWSRAGSDWLNRENVSHALQVGALVAIGYYLGLLIGRAFGYPAAQVSVLWPPNVVLIAALLLTSRRIWWVILLAPLPVQLLFFPFDRVNVFVPVLYFASNIGQALLTAALLQRFCGGVPRFDHFISTATFILVAAFAAPALVSIALGSALFLAGWEFDFGLLVLTRFLSDMLSALVLLPPVLILLTFDHSRWRGISHWRYVEAAFILILLVTSATVGLRERDDFSLNLPTDIAVPLALFVWAGIRFGVGGVSVGLLVAALLSLWSASHGHGPFALASPSQSVIGMQLFLIEVGLPIILMAALLAERRNSIRSLRESNQLAHQLAGQLINAQEDERRWVARELHDQVGQSLTIVKLNLDMLRSTSNVADARALLDEGRGLVDLALGQVRDLSLLLRPAMLDDLGLEPALQSLLSSYSKRAGYDAMLRTDGLQGRLAPELEVLCYRVAQEALTNVSRHAQAKHVWLDVIVRDGRLRMTVSDDGIGFDPEAMRARAVLGKSMGLLNMAERARLGVGDLHMASVAGKGTTLTLDVPLQPPVE